MPVQEHPLANPRQSVDEYGKQMRPRAPAAATGREAADELESTQNHASPVRQQLQAQFGRAQVDMAISGEDQSPFSTFILAEWAMGTAGLGSLTESSPEAGGHVHGLLQSPEWGAAAAGVISRYATSNEPAHAHLAVELIRRSRGQRLPTDVAARLSAALGVDISDAVIHTDAAAAEAAKAVNAHAFATGKDVFFAAGQFNPGTKKGDELLAHELTHVVQDAEGRIPMATGDGLTVSTPNQAHEREAERAGREAAGALHDQSLDGLAIDGALDAGGVGAASPDHAEQQAAGVSGPMAVSREKASDQSGETPEEIIKRFTNYGGLNLIEDELGAYLLTLLPQNVDLVDRTLDTLGSTDRDDVAFYMASGASDEQIQSIAAQGGGELIHRLMQELQSGATSGDEAKQMERLVRLGSPDYARLRGEEASKDSRVEEGLESEDASLQSIEDGSGDYIYDEYSVIIDAMPADLSPEAFLTEMTVDLNKAVNDDMFDYINTFARRPTTEQPEVGNIYDIDILGPDNGSVVLVDRTANRVVFRTITTNAAGSGDHTGSHPEYGSREFGFEAMQGGGIKFYTRGASRPRNAAVGMAGKLPQATGWTRLMRGISDAIEARGGTPRKSSFEAWSSHQ